MKLETNINICVGAGLISLDVRVDSSGASFERECC